MTEKKKEEQSAMPEESAHIVGFLRLFTEHFPLNERIVVATAYGTACYPAYRLEFLINLLTILVANDCGSQMKPDNSQTLGNKFGFLKKAEDISPLTQKQIWKAIKMRNSLFHDGPPDVHKKGKNAFVVRSPKSVIKDLLKKRDFLRDTNDMIESLINKRAKKHGLTVGKDSIGYELAGKIMEIAQETGDDVPVQFIKRSQLH